MLFAMCSYEVRMTFCQNDLCDKYCFGCSNSKDGVDDTAHCCWRINHCFLRHLLWRLALNSSPARSGLLIVASSFTVCYLITCARTSHIAHHSLQACGRCPCQIAYCIQFVLWRRCSKVDIRVAYPTFIWRLTTISYTGIHKHTEICTVLHSDSIFEWIIQIIVTNYICIECSYFSHANCIYIFGGIARPNKPNL